MRATRRITHLARQRLPHGLQEAGAAVVKWWGTRTSRWRMLPDVVIIGAQRSGTTTIFRLLSDHPQVLRPTIVKGVAFFDLNFDRGLSWYRGHFPLRATARLRGRGRRIVTFESSGYYLMHPLAPQRLAETLPDTKVIAFLRDPVVRAHSAHRHEARRGFESEPFERAIEIESERIAGEAERLAREPGYQSYEYQHHAYLERGDYAPQIRRWIEAVGPDRVYVVDAERFFSDPVAEFARMCEWIGLDPVNNPEVKAWNAAPRAPMSDELRERLEAHFEPRIRDLQAVLDELPSWPSGRRVFEQAAYGELSGSAGLEGAETTAERS